MNFGVSYQEFYNILLTIREIFHADGRIDDSNAKLDEIIKLIFLSYSEALQGKNFSLANIRQYAENNCGDSTRTAEALHNLFKESCKKKLFLNNDGSCIFGTTPSLLLNSNENRFAEKLISEIEKIDFVSLTLDNKISDFDIINECFGHFVRENFRNNKEDAQYMTPAEVSNPMLDIIFSDIISDSYLKENNYSTFTVMDPTCGVGTLLIESARKYIDHIATVSPLPNLKKQIDTFLKEGIIGQDKVDRMVRFSKINSVLLGCSTEKISIGNSIANDTAIDKFVGKVDLIFTNPPFGADYSIDSLNLQNFSHLEELALSKKKLCSEILMLLKCLKLLKKGGYLAIVLPDSVFSAKGIYAEVRKILLENYEIRAIFELPAVAFAQAGTRTKTSILYLKKVQPKPGSTITMGVCGSIGYNVKERMGVPVKIKAKQNDLIAIATSYIGNKRLTAPSVLSESPSVTLVSRELLINEMLNPNFYSASQLQKESKIAKSYKDTISLYKLSELVVFDSLGRKSYFTDKQTHHVSVLHINSNCTIDFNAVGEFTPVSKGRECKEEDLLFSKINPRIPRMTIIPQHEKRLVCSNEFEIMRAKENVDIFVICILLRSPYVQKQIENLTSGTSSSHSRIKREQLADILIPYPIETTERKEFIKIGKNMRKAFADIYNADQIIFSQITSTNNLFE